MTCEPVLTAPGVNSPVKSAVVACDVGGSAVLLQADAAGINKPVAYFSNKLKKH